MKHHIDPLTSVLPILSVCPQVAAEKAAASNAAAQKAATEKAAAEKAAEKAAAVKAAPLKAAPSPATHGILLQLKAGETADLL